MGSSRASTVPQELIVSIDLYNSEVICVVGNSSDELLDYSSSQWAIDFGDEDRNLWGLTEVIPNTDKSITVLILLLDSQVSPGLIAHEAYHGATFICNYLGLTGHESKAYLIDYLTENISLQLKQQLSRWMKK